MLRWWILITAALPVISGPVCGQDWLDGAEKAYTLTVDEHRAGRADTALHNCRLLIENYPDFVKPYYLLAWIYSEQGEPEMAAETYLALIQRRPAEFKARLYYANILLYDLRSYKAAEREYRSAHLYAKDDADAREQAERGLESVATEISRRRKFRTHRSFLRRVLAALAAGWLVVLAVGYRLTR